MQDSRIHPGRRRQLLLDNGGKRQRRRPTVGRALKLVGQWASTNSHNERTLRNCSTVRCFRLVQVSAGKVGSGQVGPIQVGVGIRTPRRSA